MTSVFQVVPHPLGVVVYACPGKLGELVLPGEGCYGLSFDQLQHAANTTGYVEVDIGEGETQLRC